MAEPGYYTPTRKVTSAGLAGGVATLLAWGFDEFAGVAMPPPVVAALTTVVMWLVAYFVPDNRRPPEVADAAQAGEG